MDSFASPSAYIVMFTNPSAAVQLILLATVSSIVWLGQCGSAAAQGSRSGESLEQIKQRQAEALERYGQDLRESSDQSSRDAATERYLKDAHANCHAALTLARNEFDDPVAVEALQFVIRTARGGPSDYSAKAFGLLAKHHFDAPKIGEFCIEKHWLSDIKENEALMRAVSVDHPLARERAYATYALALLYSRRASQLEEELVSRQLNSHGAKGLSSDLKEVDVDSAASEAISLFTRVITDYGDVRFNGSTLAIQASAELFSAERLRVGAEIPEITGLDHADTRHSLSDLRGQVVILTFTGNWCGQCTAMYPQLRQLSERYGSKGMSIASVSTDEHIDTLRHAIDEKKISWRCWWDGEDGPIVSAWGITAFPSIFVVDRAGIIRFKNLRGQRLEKAVQLLLGEPVDE